VRRGGTGRAGRVFVTYCEGPNALKETHFLQTVTPEGVTVTGEGEKSRGGPEIKRVSTKGKEGKKGEQTELDVRENNYKGDQLEKIDEEEGRNREGFP